MGTLLDDLHLAWPAAYARRPHKAFQAAPFALDRVAGSAKMLIHHAKLFALPLPKSAAGSSWQGQLHMHRCPGQPVCSALKSWSAVHTQTICDLSGKCVFPAYGTINQIRRVNAFFLRMAQSIKYTAQSRMACWSKQGDREQDCLISGLRKAHLSSSRERQVSFAFQVHWRV